jgi:hypothetical protein
LEVSGNLRSEGFFAKLAEFDVKTVRVFAAAVLAVGLAAFLIVSHLRGGESRKDGSTDGVLSRSELLGRAGTLSHPAYWLGPQPGASSYELTTADEQIYVRYLPGAEPENPRPDFLIVGTYVVPDAWHALKLLVAGNAKQKEKLTKGNGFEMMSSPSSKHAFVVFDNHPELQVEVFSPNAGDPQRLASSGALRPLSGD